MIADDLYDRRHGVAGPSQHDQAGRQCEAGDNEGDGRGHMPPEKGRRASGCVAGCLLPIDHPPCRFDLHRGIEVTQFDEPPPGISAAVEDSLEPPYLLGGRDAFGVGRRDLMQVI